MATLDTSEKIFFLNCKNKHIIRNVAKCFLKNISDDQLDYIITLNKEYNLAVRTSLFKDPFIRFFPTKDVEEYVCLKEFMKLALYNK